MAIEQRRPEFQFDRREWIDPGCGQTLALDQRPLTACRPEPTDPTNWRNFEDIWSVAARRRLGSPKSPRQHQLFGAACLDLAPSSTSGARLLPCRKNKSAQKQH